MSAVTKHEIVSLIEGLIESDACMGSISDKQVIMALELVNRIRSHGIEPSDNVKQADEETHRRVDEAVRNGRIVDKRVPVDFVLVPVEPSFAMREAGNVALDKLKSDSTMQSADKAFYVYHAMLAAAPEVKP